MKSVSHSSRKSGILRPEMFAVKSMDPNSNLLRLKYDMVYREVPEETARKRFDEITGNVTPAEVVKPKRKRQVVKPNLPVKK